MTIIPKEMLEQFEKPEDFSETGEESGLDGTEDFVDTEIGADLEDPEFEDIDVDDLENSIENDDVDVMGTIGKELKGAVVDIGTTAIRTGVDVAKAGLKAAGIAGAVAVAGAVGGTQAAAVVGGGVVLKKVTDAIK